MLEEDLDKRAVLRLCAPHLLGITRQLAAPCLDADAHRQTGLLTNLAAGETP